MSPAQPEILVVPLPFPRLPLVDTLLPDVFDAGPSRRYTFTAAVYQYLVCYRSAAVTMRTFLMMAWVVEESHHASVIRLSERGRVFPPSAYFRLA